jgi:hypothetical protein
LANIEPGHEEMGEVIRNAAISAVNLQEVAAKLADRGMPGKPSARLSRGSPWRYSTLVENWPIKLSDGLPARRRERNCASPPLDPEVRNVLEV